MGVPCVRVDREAGERTRQALAECDLVDGRHEIVAEAGALYIPVTDPDAARDALDAATVVERPVPAREQETMPADLVDFPPSYERIGDIVVIDEDDPDRARALADAVMASALPAKTVLNRASEIRGRQRVREWEVLAGTETETVHREYGHAFALDLAAVYFSPRLATERHRVVGGVRPGEHVFDLFAGVGPFVVPAAARGAEAVGVDINDRAIEYLRANADRNGVADRVTAIHGDVREVEGYEGWADRLVMNLPHSADDFLDTAVELAADEAVLHYYDIQSDEDPYGPGERAIRAAAEGYEVTVENRRTVRSYAPHELNVVLDIRLSR
jgi:tRNA (guanine37-N1)-methyltransferase